MGAARRGDRLKGDEADLFDGSFMLGERALQVGLIDGLNDINSLVRTLGGERAVARRSRLAAAGCCGVCRAWRWTPCLTRPRNATGGSNCADKGAGLLIGTGARDVVHHLLACRRHPPHHVRASNEPASQHRHGRSVPRRSGRRR